MTIAGKIGIAICAILLLITHSVMSGSEDNTDYRRTGSIGLIETAYSTGKIVRGDKIFYNLQAVLDPGSLPEEYKAGGESIIRSGTPFVNEALDNWEMMSPAQQATAAALLARPDNDSVYISPDSHFAIHYNIGGSNGVPPEDLDASGVPDYVERIGIYADSSYRRYHNNLGYYPPPSDIDSLYDIHLLYLGNAYGVTIRESAGDSAWQDYGSHIQIHNNFSFAPPNDDPEGTVIGAQKVTVAHEYFHATQMAYAYKGGDDLWWTEGSAVFFENDVYDEVNDHYYYLPYFFNYPDTFLIDTSYLGSYLHNYSTFVWPEYLAKKFGVEIIRSVWEHLRYYDPLTAMDSALYPFGKDMKNVFPEFTLWNYFTRNRYDTAFHDDGADYPLIVVGPVVPSCPFTGVMPIIPPDGLASNYIVTYPDTTVNGVLVIDFDGDNTVQWGFSYATVKDAQIEAVPACEVDYLGRTNCGIYDFVRYDSLIFVPCVVSQWQDDNLYSFSTTIHPFGDIDGSGAVNVLDISYLVNYLYKGGARPVYDIRMGDPDCNGHINILDISYIISYLYRGGPEPCAYRP